MLDLDEKNSKEKELNFLPGLNQSDEESEDENEEPSVLENLPNSLTPQVVNSISEIDENEEHWRILRKMDEAGLTEEYLFKRMFEWMNEAVMEWPKTGTVYTDWKAIASLAKQVIAMRKLTKSDKIINILNAFWWKAEKLY